LEFSMTDEVETNDVPETKPAPAPVVESPPQAPVPSEVNNAPMAQEEK